MFYFNYELQCGANLTFVAMTGSFRFWMEALEMRGKHFGSAWCGRRYDVCEWVLKSVLERWLMAQLCIGFAVKYFIAGCAMAVSDDASTYRKGV